MKVITYNIRSWYRDIKAGPRNWKRRAADIKALLTKEQPDVILIQEALPPMTAKCISDGYVKASGCSISHHIFVRDGFAEVERAGWHLRWCWALLRLPNAKRVAVVCVHTRWEKDIREATAKAIATLRTGGAPIIAGGDWNNEPDVMRLPLFPLELRTTDLTTHQNWETKKEYELDYFAISSNVGAFAYWLGSWTDSDHLAVMLETENI